MEEMKCCDLYEFLNAMRSETRQRILSLLHEHEMSVNELKEHFSQCQSTISHHLAILRRANLVHVRRDGQQRFYRANPVCVEECCGEILDRFKIQRQRDGNDDR